MVTFRGKNLFYTRRDDRTVKMTTDEVKRTVIEVVNLQNDMDKYVSMVEEEIAEDYVGDDFSLLMHAVPYILDEAQVNTSVDGRFLLQGPHIALIRLGSLSPDVHGTVGSQSQSESDCAYQIHLHRTGYIGLALKVEKFWKLRGNTGEDLKYVGDSFKGIFKDFFMLCKEVTDQSGVLSPYQIRCTLVNSAGAVYRYPSGWGVGYNISPVAKRSRLKIASVRVDSFKDIDAIVDLLFLRLKNAFGLE